MQVSQIPDKNLYLYIYRLLAPDRQTDRHLYGSCALKNPELTLPMAKYLLFMRNGPDS